MQDKMFLTYNVSSKELQTFLKGENSLRKSIKNYNEYDNCVKYPRGTHFDLKFPKKLLCFKDFLTGNP